MKTRKIELGRFKTDTKSDRPECTKPHSRGVPESVLLEAMELGLSGGLLGVLVGAAATLMVAHVADWQAVLVPETPLLAVAYSAADCFRRDSSAEGFFGKPCEFVARGSAITYPKGRSDSHSGRGALICRKRKPRGPYTR